MNNCGKNKRESLKVYSTDIINRDQILVLRIGRKPRWSIMEMTMQSRQKDMGKMKRDIRIMFPTNRRKKDGNWNYKGNSKR